ncbi:MAG: aminoacyl-tRNA hydrolase [Candidatus Hodarchaeales archaeon]
MLKQAIVIRSDLKMTKGKIVNQVVNASLSAAMKTKLEKAQKFERWLNNGQKKVVLKVTDAGEFENIEKACLASRVVTIKTCLPGGIVTALGIGPDSEIKIDELTGHLKLL